MLYPYVIERPEQLPSWMIRTEIPTVVANRCEDAYDLAVWRAINWLMAIEDRTSMGLDARTIAAHAKIDVKTALRSINGDRPTSKAKYQPRIRKQGLVNLGLLEITGYEAVGKLNPRPIYHIPKWIYEQNARFTWDLLSILGKGPPAALPPPEPQQQAPFDLVPNSTQDKSTLRPELRLAPDSAQARGSLTAGRRPNLDQEAGLDGAATGRAADSAQGRGRVGAGRDPNLDQEAELDRATTQGSSPLRVRCDPNLDQGAGLDGATTQGRGRVGAGRGPNLDQGGGLDGASAGLDPNSAQGRGRVGAGRGPNLDQGGGLDGASAGLDPDSAQGTDQAKGYTVPKFTQREIELLLSAGIDPSKIKIIPRDTSARPDALDRPSGGAATDPKSEQGHPISEQGSAGLDPKSERSGWTDGRTDGGEEGSGTPPTNFGYAAPRAQSAPTNSGGDAARPEPSASTPYSERDPFEGLPPYTPPTVRPGPAPLDGRDPFAGLPPYIPPTARSGPTLLDGRDPFEGLPPYTPPTARPGPAPLDGRDPFEGLPPYTPPPARSGGDALGTPPPARSGGDAFGTPPPARSGDALGTPPPAHSGASFSVPPGVARNVPPPEVNDSIPPPWRVGTQPPPATPPDHLMSAHPLWVLGDLPAHPLDLWRRACSTRRTIDDDQLSLLASEHNRTTGGHGLYWVGRAILAAALSEDIHSVAKVRRTLERWRSEDSYGSDAPSRRSTSGKTYTTARSEHSGEPPAKEMKLSERLGYSDDMFRPFSMDNR